LLDDFQNCIQYWSKVGEHRAIRSEVTDATLNHVGNVPSLKASAAKRAINGENKFTDDLITDAEIWSITYDFAGMLLIRHWLQRSG